MFFVQEVYSGGGCGRRPMVVPISDVADKISKYEVGLEASERDDGIYVLSLNRPFGLERSYSFEEYKKFRELDPDLTYYFKSFLKMKWVHPDILEKKWRANERAEYKKYFVEKALDWCLFVLSFIFLAISIYYFIKWLRDKSIKYFVVAFCIQSFLFVGVFFINMWAPPLFVLVSMFVPIIWLYELIHFGVHLFNKNRLTTRPEVDRN